jgi:hypothetical protein
MAVHFRRVIGPPYPLCWTEEEYDKGYQSNQDIEKVTCDDCKSLYYLTGKELEVTRASFDLWLDGRDMDESAAWRQPVNLDFDRFLSDSEYAELVSNHITRVLADLAREIEGIGVRNPPTAEK